MSRILSLWRNLLHRNRIERDLDDEVRAMLELLVDEKVRAGMTPEEARRAATLELGKVESVKEQVRDRRAGAFVDTLLQDVQYGVRLLRRNPLFALTAVLSLAIGIGANTAVFSVLNIVVLQPLPYAEPDRIVGLWDSWTDTPRASLSPEEYLDYLERVDEFEHLGVYRSDFVTLTGSGEPARLPVGIISSGLLPALGVSPAIGRRFSASEDLPGNDDVVMLSEGLWRRRFGASPDILGRVIVLDGRTCTVIGVVPSYFRLPNQFAASEPAQIFVPLGLRRGSVPRGVHFLFAVARLKSTATREEAAARVRAVAAQFAIDMPADYAGHVGAVVTRLHEDVIGEVRSILLTLLGAIGFVQLIVCANITNLFLSRSERRRQEFSVRAALGAARLRLIRQSLVESGLVAFAGGTAGVALAVMGTRILVALRPRDLPRLDDVQLDGYALGFAAGLTISVALFVGVIPALRGAPSSGRPTGLDDRTTTGGAVQHRLRRALVVAQVTLAIVLLLGAGLMARSFVQLISVDPGYRTDRQLTASITVPVADYNSLAQVSGFFAALLDRVRAQSAVSAAGAVAGLPLTGERGDLGIQIEGRETPPGTRSRRADWQVVTPGYFEAMGMRFLRGRSIQRFDLETSPGVVVINESAARLHWRDADPIGTRLKLGRSATTWLTVVGIVNDVRQGSLRSEPGPEIYLAHTQFDFFGGPVRSLTVVLRATGEPSALASTLRREVAALDPNIPIGSVQTMDQVWRASTSTLEFVLLLLSTFAAVALAVALVGVYSVMAYSVAQRRREIGIRIALGARPRAVIALMLRQALSPVVVGIVMGLTAGIALNRFLAGQLFEVSPSDPLTAVLVSGLVAAVAVPACYVPAHRAATTTPLDALRPE